MSARSRHTARGVAYAALLRIDHEGAYANLLVPELLGRSSLSERDRALATSLAYGTTRMRRACDFSVDRFLVRDPPPELRTLLRLGAFQLVFAGTPPHAAVHATVELAPTRLRGVTNAVLRKVATHPPVWPDDATRLSYPDWIVARLVSELGERAGLATLEHMDLPPAVHVRADGYVQDPSSQRVAELVGARPGERVADLCAAPGGKATAIASTIGVSEVAAPALRALEVTPTGAEAGLASPRGDARPADASDAASVAPSEGGGTVEVTGTGAERGLASPRGGAGPGDAGDETRVTPSQGAGTVELTGTGAEAGLASPRRAGLAAGAGATAHGSGAASPAQQSSSTSGAAAGSVVALDLRPHRARLVAANAARLALPNLFTVVADATAPPLRAASFDRVLLDAPCSGLGALRRRPDARWRIVEADIADLVDLQRRLLAAACDLVRPGGRLVYSVCTLTAAESIDHDTGVLASWPVEPPPGPPWQPYGRGARLLPHEADADGMVVLSFRRPR